MNTKTILNVLIAILLCASTLASVVSAQDEGAMEDLHTVNISVDHDEENENELTITVALEWNYPSQLRGTVEGEDKDGTVDINEEEEYTMMLDAMSLDELQAAHKSHVWDISIAGQSGSAGGDIALPWTISTSTAGLQGNTTDNNSFTISVTLSIDVNSDDFTDGNLAMTLGPLGDKDGGSLVLPTHPTSVTVVDGTTWCTTSIVDSENRDLASSFGYHTEDDFDFTATYSQSNDCQEEDRTDTDRDGVPDDVDDCPTVAGLADNAGCPADEGCSGGLPDSDGDGVDDCSDACPSTADGAEVDPDGCSADETPDEEEDMTFNVTFNIGSASYTCIGMTNASSAQDCMDAADATLGAAYDGPAGHPHEWSWELQVNGATVADQNAANMTLVDGTTTFSWVVSCASGVAGCNDKTVLTVENLTGDLSLAKDDCVFFGDLNVSFGDDWDTTDSSSRCFPTEGVYTAGDLTITVGTVAGNTTDGTDPIGDDTMKAEESTPGFGLVAGISAVLGAALIAASRKED